MTPSSMLKESWFNHVALMSFLFQTLLF